MTPFKVRGKNNKTSIYICKQRGKKQHKKVEKSNLELALLQHVEQKGQFLLPGTHPDQFIIGGYCAGMKSCGCWVFGSVPMATAC